LNSKLLTGDAIPISFGVEMNQEFYPCPCCGFLTFSESSGSYEICPICFWEDDGIQLAFPNLPGGANRVSLIKGQENYRNIGVCESAMKVHVREPSESDNRDDDWVPYEPDQHHALDWNSAEDHELWDRIKNESPNIYYWKPSFWRNRNAEQVSGGNGGERL
jgi:Cysteine-rich CPCC